MPSTVVAPTPSALGVPKLPLVPGQSTRCPSSYILLLDHSQSLSPVAVTPVVQLAMSSLETPIATSFRLSSIFPWHAILESVRSSTPLNTN